MNSQEILVGGLLMRISGVTYAVRRRSKKIIILKVIIALILLSIAITFSLSFFLGWQIPFIQKAIDTVNNLLGIVKV